MEKLNIFLVNLTKIMVSTVELSIYVTVTTAFSSVLDSLYDDLIIIGFAAYLLSIAINIMDI